MSLSKTQQQAYEQRAAAISMALLAVQFGIQPILTRRYTDPNVTRSTVILVQELFKFVLASTMLLLSGKFQSAVKDWTIASWISVAVVPAALYAVQNLAALLAYQNLDALTFNVLNQTKTLSAAVCCYFVMGRKQSMIQVFALILLLVSALVMEGIISLDKYPWKKSDDDKGDLAISWDHLTHGVAPIMLASFISGLAGALSQKKLQASVAPRNEYLFSMELCVASVILLVTNMVLTTGERTAILQHGFFHDWTIETLIPIVTNSCGGIIVGVVTKYAGSVRKGFALILGIFLSGLMQAVLQPDVGVTREQCLGGALAAVSLYLHATYPPKIKTTKQD